VERAPDLLIVGGGIAGLAALARCAERGVRGLLLEREPWLAGHASGRNAAIFRPLEDDASTAPLAARSLAWLDAALGVAPLEQVGLVLAAEDEAALEPLVQRARREQLEHALLVGDALGRVAPALRGGSAHAGLQLAQAGVLDNHAMLTALERYARAGGGALRTGTSVTRILARDGHVTGVELEGGETIACGAVVLAAGAWSGALGGSLGSRVALQPIRRHLVQLETEAIDRAHPVVWRVDGAHAVYFRAESGGVLASPCDAVPVEAASHAVSAIARAVSAAPNAVPNAATPNAWTEAGELLGRKLASTAPRLVSARVKRAWACLRTFAPDGELVVGADPAAAGLFWLAGLGGRGMAVAVAAGELLADSITASASSSDLAGLLSPARF
jgi:D-arginine dehydrogenase